MLTTGYSYDGNGQLQTMTYPSGKVLGYQYDSHGQLTGLTLDGQPLLSAITWSPFGPVSGWTWSNGSHYSRTFDQDGQIIIGDVPRFYDTTAASPAASRSMGSGLEM